MVETKRYQQQLIDLSRFPFVKIPKTGNTKSDYHFIASMGHANSEQRYGSYEDVKNGSMNGSQRKRKICTDVVFTNCQRNGKNI